ncbi:MAG: nucleoside phosphorylase [Thermomicrobiales bacterium]
MSSGIGREWPILEFDPAREAILEPSQANAAGVRAPERCVVCFFQDVIAQMRQEGRAREIAFMRSEIGSHPLYEIEHNGQPLALFHPGVGAPLAACLLEEVIAHGCRKFIACGGAGVLDPEIAVGQIVVPDRAVRDEGTSYHYLPPGREVAATPEAVAAIEATLARYGVPYRTGTTWTTDGLYRETREKMRLRKAEGCLTVEMEAATFFAVARFRGVQFGQMLYGGDDLSGEWDSRDWTTHTVREKLFWLAADACLML